MDMTNHLWRAQMSAENSGRKFSFRSESSYASALTVPFSRIQIQIPYRRFAAARQTTIPRGQLPTAKAQLHRLAIHADVDDAFTF
jgi:hypothetical protein